MGINIQISSKIQGKKKAKDEERPANLQHTFLSLLTRTDRAHRPGSYSWQTVDKKGPGLRQPASLEQRTGANFPEEHYRQQELMPVKQMGTCVCWLFVTKEDGRMASAETVSTVALGTLPLQLCSVCVAWDSVSEEWHLRCFSLLSLRTWVALNLSVVRKTAVWTSDTCLTLKAPNR